MSISKWFWAPGQLLSSLSADLLFQDFLKELSYTTSIPFPMDQWLSKLLRPANRYGELAELPTFQEGGCFFHQLSNSWAVGFGDSGHHVPTLALINPMPEPYHLWYSSAVDENLEKKNTQSRSGAAAGMDILSVARRCDYYKAGFFYWLSTVPTDCRIDYGWQIPSHDLHSKFLG